MHASKIGFSFVPKNVLLLLLPPSFLLPPADSYPSSSVYILEVERASLSFPLAPASASFSAASLPSPFRGSKSFPYPPSFLLFLLRSIPWGQRHLSLPLSSQKSSLSRPPFLGAGFVRLALLLSEVDGLNLQNLANLRPPRLSPAAKPIPDTYRGGRERGRKACFVLSAIFCELSLPGKEGEGEAASAPASYPPMAFLDQPPPFSSLSLLLLLLLPFRSKTTAKKKEEEKEEEGEEEMGWQRG